MDRHVIANMGAELGATTSVVPADETVRQSLASQGRENDGVELIADEGCEYDDYEEIDLSQIEPLIAMPFSRGNVRPVHEVAGRPIYQAYICSSANPGYRDCALVAQLFQDRRVHPGVSLDINPASRQILENLARDGHLTALIRAGARLHQAGCNGCIGMGQAPASGRISLRTPPRNFPGRSGTPDDQVSLVSPATAAASALRGVITDARDLNLAYPEVHEAEQPILNREMFEPPPKAGETIELVKGSNFESLPELLPLPDVLEVEVLLKVGDDISTDEIPPPGARVLPFRSNIPALAEFAFESIDANYRERALKTLDAGGHAIVSGRNYGQGSSREHAALAPRFLRLRLVLAKGLSRIHW